MCRNPHFYYMHALARHVVLGRQKEVIILFQLSEVIFGP